MRDKPLKPTKAEVDKMAKRVAKRKEIDPKHLEFIGAYDYNELGVMFYFNITDKKHPDYMGTMGEKV